MTSRGQNAEQDNITRITNESFETMAKFKL